MSDEPTPHAPPSTRRTAIGSMAPDRARTNPSIRRIAVGTGDLEQATQVGALRVGVMLAVVALSVGLAVGWMVIARQQLAASGELAGAHALDRAHGVFQLVRARTQDDLRAQARVLVEDPRLKATLATEGVDEATVADILADLRKLRGTGFLIVLSHEARVFAEAGAPELRGLDLSGSSVVKAAQGSQEAVVGSWVLKGEVLDLGVIAMRFGPELVAYLVVGRAVDQGLLTAVAEQSGVALASASPSGVVLASSTDPADRAALAGAAARPGAYAGGTVDVGGQAYAAAAFELERGAQSEVRLIATRSLAEALPSLDKLTWMIRGLPLLVLLAVLFSITASRRTVVVTRARRAR
jgi:hypothetical protein